MWASAEVAALENQVAQGTAVILMAILEVRAKGETVSCKSPRPSRSY